jgi:hypothetical protein
MRFSHAVQLAGHGRARLAVQGRVPLTDKPLANPDDLALAQANFCGDLVVRLAPAGLAVVGEQQDPSPPQSRGRHRLSPADRFKPLSLVGSKTNAHLVNWVRHPCLRCQENAENCECFTIP